MVQLPTARWPEGYTCDVCEDEPVVGVFAVPGVPISMAYGQKCLDAHAHPYGIVVANTAMIGLYPDSSDDWRANVAPWWVQIVEDTLKHLGKTEEQFKADVEQAVREMDEVPDGQ